MSESFCLGFSTCSNNSKFGYFQPIMCEMVVKKKQKNRDQGRKDKVTKEYMFQAELQYGSGGVKLTSGNNNRNSE